MWNCIIRVHGTLEEGGKRLHTSIMMPGGSLESILHTAIIFLHLNGGENVSTQKYYTRCLLWNVVGWQTTTLRIIFFFFMCDVSPTLLKCVNSVYNVPEVACLGRGHTVNLIGHKWSSASPTEIAFSMRRDPLVISPFLLRKVHIFLSSFHSMITQFHRGVLS
jgi:hypothetical protein